MGKLKVSTAEKNRRSVYRDRALDNRRKRLERHLKKHPEDVQAQKALENPTVRSGRKSFHRNKTLHYNFTALDVMTNKKKKPSYTLNGRYNRSVAMLDRRARKAEKVFYWNFGLPASKRADAFYKHFGIEVAKTQLELQNG